MAKKKKISPKRTTFADYGLLDPVTRVVESKKTYKRPNKGNLKKELKENANE